jgi:sulfide dehydrogenase [flavocytochrome c] flavoprotein subunit
MKNPKTPGFNRREAIKFATGALLAGSLPAVATAADARIVVIGGGAAGTIVAKHLVMANPALDVTLIERDAQYQSALMSNAMLSGIQVVDNHTFGYDGLKKRGINLVHATVTGIDPEAKVVVTSSGTASYDRLILAPGVGRDLSAIEGYDDAARQLMPDAWQDPNETALLRRQIEDMPEGGTVLLAMPRAAFSCPTGPYERVSHIAHFLKQANPRSKILVVDANDQFQAQDLFMQAWETFYPGMIEWVKGSDTGGGVRRVDSKSMKLFTEDTDFQADVANVILPQRAGNVANLADVTDTTGWAPVDVNTLESTRQPGIHVIGDASTVGQLPKSAQIANSQAIVCAEAIVAILNGTALPNPRYFDIAYNVVAPNYAFSTVDVYRVSDDKTGVIKVRSGQSALDAPLAHRRREFAYAQSWYNNITNAMFS